MWFSICSHVSDQKIPEIEKAAGLWIPAIDAYEAGLWLFWIVGDEIIAMSRPAIQIRDNQIHCDDGPAIYWPKVERYYFLNGVQVTKEIVETPADSLDPHVLLKEANAEVRREIVRKIGIERVILRLDAVSLDKDGNYELLSLDLGDGRKRPYLKMLNPSIGVWHVEGVGPECSTVAEALHWRKPDDMRAIPVSDDGEDFQQQGDVYVWPLGAKSLKAYPSILT